MSANILTPRQECARKCSVTFRHEHGGALPGGPFPGTQGEAGDVRRCEHGRVWEWVKHDFVLDEWECISPFWEWAKYRRAIRALGEASRPASDAEPQPQEGGRRACRWMRICLVLQRKMRRR